MKKFLITFFAASLVSFAQTKTPTSIANSNPVPGYWQQGVKYTMDIDVDAEKYQYTGKQTLEYTNNSPDILNQVFYHLYFNAFQPGSQMDVRSRTIQDPDRRVGDRISKLKPEEIGYIKVNTLTQNGKAVEFEEAGTILEVKLNEPIQPGETVTFEMNYKAQIPAQIRRSGRNNKEGVALSMTQWYPKMAEYDFEGWHTPAYIAREFHGVWGDFDVTIHLDRNYMIGGSGYLQNPQEVGHGYEDKSKPLKLPKGDKLSWHFKAPDVHDFAWAADNEYAHDILTMDNGIDLHFIYKKTLEDKYLKNWKDIQPKTEEMMDYFSKHVGQYPYKQYTVIQGGDGGMEYAMSTLVTGQRSFRSLFGVTAHEMAHSWFQFVLAFNENKHPWMDEGFTVYISNKAENEILNQNKANPSSRSYSSYYFIVQAGLEEVLTTNADRYDRNSAYGVASYSKGDVFLAQLEYVIGSENVAKGLKKLFNDFAFKHPTPNDVKRTMEKVSGIHLDWYLNEFTQTTHTIDYAIKTVENNKVTLERIGQMPMPIDVEVEYTDGTKEAFYIPLRMMRGEKTTDAKTLEDWAWAYPTYTFETSKSVKSVTIDKSGFMADIDQENNKFVVE